MDTSGQPYPGESAQPSAGPVPAADSEPVVSAATWAASPGARRAAARGYPPLAGPPGDTGSAERSFFEPGRTARQ